MNALWHIVVADQGERAFAKARRTDHNRQLTAGISTGEDWPAVKPLRMESHGERPVEVQDRCIVRIVGKSWHRNLPQLTTKLELDILPDGELRQRVSQSEAASSETTMARPGATCIPREARMKEALAAGKRQ